MKHFSVLILLAIFFTLLGGSLVWDSRANSNPADNSQAYQSDQFALQVPTTLKKTFDIVEDGQSVLAYENSDGSEAFQVFSLPFSGSLTTQRIQQGYPWNVIDDFGLLAVGGEPAFTFVNDNNDLGGTFEVWFVHDGLLYQVMTDGRLDTWLKDILTTWRFR